MIRQAQAHELPAILALQKLAYLSEAALYQDWSIPPLTETLAELEQEFACSRILIAEEQGVIVGAVRGRQEEECCRIGRLSVTPERQNQGIGKALMQAIEAAHPQAKRFELFTGNRSSKNLALYQALGYAPLRQEALGKITLVFLEKRASTRPGTQGYG